MEKYRPIIVGSALGLLACAIGFGLGTDLVEEWQLAARYTARIAFLLFLWVYCLGPAYQLTHAEILRNPLRNRRAWGLGFAAAHGVHLAALVTFLVLSGRHAALTTLLFGGFGYVVLLALVLTSNDAAVQHLGPQWKRLHRFGIHYVWLIFMLTYLGRITSPAPALSSYLMLMIGLAGAGLRLAAFLSGRPKARPGGA
ncbi:MAG: hypothetical protein ACKOXK_08615 [Chakrabartia sp.]